MTAASNGKPRLPNPALDWAVDPLAWWNDSRWALTNTQVQEVARQSYRAGWNDCYHQLADQGPRIAPKRPEPPAERDEFVPGIAAIEAWLETREGRKCLALEQKRRDRTAGYDLKRKLKSI